MAYLFDIVDKKALPKPEALLVEPFKTIWERDKSSKKYKAIQEFSYIEFMVSQKNSNPYKGYNFDIKEDKILNSVFKDEKWEPDELVLDAMKRMEIWQKEASPTYTFYQSTLTAVEKLKDFFNNFSMSETSEKTGLPIYKPRDITAAIKDADDLITKLKKLETKVLEELEEAEKRTRADKNISYFSKLENYDI